MQEVLHSGKYQEVDLKGHKPTLAYKSDLVQGLCNAITTRFQLEKKEISVVKATTILNIQSWPVDRAEAFKGYPAGVVLFIVACFCFPVMFTHTQFSRGVEQFRFLFLLPDYSVYNISIIRFTGPFSYVIKPQSIIMFLFILLQSLATQKWTMWLHFTSHSYKTPTQTSVRI